MSFSESLDQLIAENRNELLGTHPSWERAELRSIARVLNGFPFPSANFSRDSGKPLLRIRDILEQSTETKYEGAFDPLYLVQGGDLLIGMDGDFNSALWNGPEALLNQRVCKLKVSESLYSKKLLSYAIPGYLKAINDATSSITVKHLSSRTVEEIPLPLPPRSEQDRIVAEIEKQFTRLDAAVLALKRVQANLKRYRASVLKAACEGRLVPTEAELARQEGRAYEPASELLKRILAERRAKWEADQLQKMIAVGKPPKNDQWKQKYKEPEPPAAVDVPELPEGWLWTSIGEAFTVHIGATPRRNKPEYWGGYIAWVSSGEVAFCHIAETRETITEKGLNNTSTEIHPPGTVLLGMIGEGKTRGQVAILDIAACNNQNSAAIRVSADLSTDYLYCYLQGEYERTRRLSSGNNQPALNKTRVERMIFPLPPASEQTRIAEFLSEKLSILDNTERQCQVLVKRAAQLRKATLKRAFSGQLVSQYPNDEPASVLLERIGAERALGKPARAWVDKTGTLRTSIQISQDFSCETCGAWDNISSCSACEVPRCERHLYGANRLCTECSNTEEWGQNDTALQYAASVALTHLSEKMGAP